MWRGPKWPRVRAIIWPFFHRCSWKPRQKPESTPWVHAPWRKNSNEIWWWWQLCALLFVCERWQTRRGTVVRFYVLWKKEGHTVFVFKDHWMLIESSLQCDAMTPFSQYHIYLSFWMHGGERGVLGWAWFNQAVGVEVQQWVSASCGFELVCSGTVHDMGMIYWLICHNCTISCVRVCATPQRDKLMHFVT